MSGPVRSVLLVPREPVSVPSSSTFLKEVGGGHISRALTFNTPSTHREVQKVYNMDKTVLRILMPNMMFSR